MYVICDRAHLRAVEIGPRILVQVRLAECWTTLCAGDAAGERVDALLDEMADVQAEVRGRLADLRTEPADDVWAADELRVCRTYRALCRG